MKNFKTAMAVTFLLKVTHLQTWFADMEVQ